MINYQIHDSLEGESDVDSAASNNYCCSIVRVATDIFFFFGYVTMCVMKFTGTYTYCVSMNMNIINTLIL